MAVNSEALKNSFGSVDVFDLEAHKKKLIEQYFPNLGQESTICQSIEKTLLEARDGAERLRLEFMIENYAKGCFALEQRMKGSIGDILTKSA